MYSDDSIIDQIREVVGTKIYRYQDIEDEAVKEVITDVVSEMSKNHFLTLNRKRHLITTVFNSMRGLDVIQPLLEDPTITEIMVNGPSEIFIERDGRSQQVDVRFKSRERLESVIQSVVAKVNRIVNESSPVVDARLPDGSRVNVVLPPVALKGPTLTIRKFSEHPLTLETLINMGSVSQEAVQCLQRLVRAKYNIFISGGTGSGKTTFLNALSRAIPQHERVITIEDSAELQLKGLPNLVSLETRNANTEGKGEISIRQLLKNSLRMRPDRIIIGEVRGSEAYDMLQAMNTGQDGSLSTGHANSTSDMLSRLETMVLSGVSLPVEAIRKQIAAAIDIMVHLGRLHDGSRKVLEISEVEGYEDGNIVLNPLFCFSEDSLRSTGRELKKRYKLIMAGLADEEGGQHAIMAQTNTGTDR